ncbi:unnamed protein product [Paramecium primaurelia]|uniref:Tubulin-tyrosine ligase family protein n=1 Tax=Paramecium primaurelia TaxID=5886 RepID=A0A8S1L045_PARPR|nr:unnamed protein product [Paramecium primaurelia]
MQQQQQQTHDISPWNENNDDIKTVTEQQVDEFKTSYEDFQQQQNLYKKQKSIKVNTTNCRGETRLIRKLIVKNNWKEVFNDGDVCWLGLPFKYQNFEEYFTQYVNRFPGMDLLAHKTQSSFYLNKFAQYFPDEYEFFPKTYIIPDEIDKFQQEYKSTRTYIAKPDAGSQGDGIYLIKKLKDIKTNESMVIQQYISKPLLIDKKKFDLRLYVLITSLDPYLCYINKEGLARFCTVDYEQPNDKNLRNPFMHLTNYSLNKKSTNFQFYNGKNILDINEGTKRTYSSIQKNLEILGYNNQDVENQIDSLIVAYLKSLLPFLAFNQKLVFQKRVAEVKCFQVLGFDILLDEKGKPWLLEVNSNPSLQIEHEVYATNGKSVFEESYIDSYVKELVMGDAIKLAMIPKEDQEELPGFQSYRKLDVDATETIFSKMMQLYGFLSGYKFQEYLTSSKFQKLSNFPQMTSQTFLKHDYDLLFRKIILKSCNNNQMDFFQFINALEQLANRLNQDLEEMLDRLNQNF